MTNSSGINTPINRKQQCLLFGIRLSARRCSKYPLHSYSDAVKRDKKNHRRNKNVPKKRLRMSVTWKLNWFNSNICYSKRKKNEETGTRIHSDLVKTIDIHACCFVGVVVIFKYVDDWKTFRDYKLIYLVTMWMNVIIWNVLQWTWPICYISNLFFFFHLFIFS